ncbi:MAG: NAD(+) synthase [Deltaproteobacteria bacterium]|jgi:NAD+ synthase|nr:NAD(+) synthase [Deltaproteobacteria bacterium]MBW2516701.1 NAD(+) synthase [Deltaproteobacteria bacterium]
MKSIKLATMDCKQVCKEIGDFVIDVVRQAASSGCVIGLSGGVDSSTAAALIKNSFDRYNAERAEDEQALELVGYILPSSVNVAVDESDAVSVAKHLGLRYEIHSIEALVEAFKSTNPEAFENKFHKGNMISRIRANVLSTKAATENKTLSGTGNRDEDFGIGYYTLFGDGAVHFSPIAGLPKRLVREMARFLGLDKQIIQREPTAGLEPGQSDLKDLGYDYDAVEMITEGLSQGFSAEELIKHPQIVPLIEEQIQQYQSVFGNAKFDSVKAVVRDVFIRHQIAEQKMKIIHPPTPRITLSYE